MATSITLAKEYVPILDTVYATSSLTGLLEANPMAVRPTGRAGSFEIAKLALVGAGTYNRATGFPAGDATLTWEEKTYSQDRGRTFTIDAMDDLESAGQAFGMLASEFIRVKVVPEVDAYRFAAIASASGISSACAAITTSASALTAWDTAIAALGNGHVTLANVVAFMSWNIYTLLKNSTAVTRFAGPGQNVDRNFETFDGVPIVKVPTDEFYTGVAMNAGASGGAGGYASASGAVGINFLLVDKTAVFCDMKHAVPRIFEPGVNQSADAYKFDYRYYHDCWVLENKVSGVYLHKSTS